MTTTLQEMIAAANAVVPKISLDDAQEMIAAGEALVVDVRDSAEVAKTGKVAGAINVSRGLLEFKVDPSSPAFDCAFRHDRPIILYCGTGGRSALAGKTLRDLGFLKVYNLGGFNLWEAEGLPVDRP
jgi:rhodanese-related sulfurtransferase